MRAPLEDDDESREAGDIHSLGGKIYCILQTWPWQSSRKKKGHKHSKFPLQFSTSCAGDSEHLEEWGKAIASCHPEHIIQKVKPFQQGQESYSELTGRWMKLNIWQTRKETLYRLQENWDQDRNLPFKKPKQSPKSTWPTKEGLENSPSNLTDLELFSKEEWEKKCVL